MEHSRFSKKESSKQTAHLKQSGIRAASARCLSMGGINLGQGICDIPAHTHIKQAASEAIFSDKNTYAPHEGIWPLRENLAHKIAQFNRVTVDPYTEILVSHGSTGAFVSAAKTLFDPGEEVILLEPFYGYHKHVLELLGISIKAVPMTKDGGIDSDRLLAAVTPKTKGIVVCTPCNPSGKVLSEAELMTIGEFAQQHDLFIISDEIYEYITYPGSEHISIASLRNYRDRTVSMSGFSKTYNITGWRLGYAYAPAWMIEKMALVHDLLYICPPTPLQHAMLAALQLDENYYQKMRADFLSKRDLMLTGLRKLGFTMQTPQGSYYLLADFTAFGFEDDEMAALKLLEGAKVATVPGRAFYQDPKSGAKQLRFCFALSEDKLQKALEQLTKFLCK